MHRCSSAKPAWTTTLRVHFPHPHNDAQTCPLRAGARVVRRSVLARRSWSDAARQEAHWGVSGLLARGAPRLPKAGGWTPSRRGLGVLAETVYPRGLGPAPATRRSLSSR